MGMFDYIKCEYPLPDNPPEWVKRHALNGEFQTKDTDAQNMETYTITADGRLIHHSVRYEEVPENERPYWGKPEWDTSEFSRLCGCVRGVSTGDVEIDLHGDLFFYTCNEEVPVVFFEYVVRFTNGRLHSIKRVGGPTPHAGDLRSAPPVQAGQTSEGETITGESHPNRANA